MRGETPDRFRTLFLRASDTTKPISAWVVKNLRSKVLKAGTLLDLFPGEADHVQITLQPRIKPGDMVSKTLLGACAFFRGQRMPKPALARVEELAAFFKKVKPCLYLERTEDDGDVMAAVKAVTRDRVAVINDGSIKASTWTNLTEVIDDNGLVDMEQTIRNGMNDANNIHFNVEGMTNWRDIVANTDPSAFRPPSTNWELATVMSDKALKAKTKLYNGPGKPTICS